MFYLRHSKDGANSRIFNLSLNLFPSKSFLFLIYIYSSKAWIQTRYEILINIFNAIYFHFQKYIFKIVLIFSLIKKIYIYILRSPFNNIFHTVNGMQNFFYLKNKNFLQKIFYNIYLYSEYRFFISLMYECI